jgi:hypothetical protein
MIVTRPAAVVANRMAKHNNSYNIPIHEAIREGRGGHRKRQRPMMDRLRDIGGGMMVSDCFCHCLRTLFQNLQKYISFLWLGTNGKCLFGLSSTLACKICRGIFNSRHMASALNSARIGTLEESGGQDSSLKNLEYG